MMGYGTGLGSGLGGVVWILGCVVLVAGLVILVVWAVSRATAHDREANAHGRSDSLDILRARFARGEISEAEYTQSANVLKADR